MRNGPLSYATSAVTRQTASALSTNRSDSDGCCSSTFQFSRGAKQADTVP
jgi:hypothetical protein